MNRADAGPVNRSTLFTVGVVVAVIFIILAILWFAGVGVPGISGRHIKHGILAVGIAVVAGLFALANRPMAAAR
jgi:hypothetical protein